MCVREDPALYSSHHRITPPEGDLVTANSEILRIIPRGTYRFLTRSRMFLSIFDSHIVSQIRGVNFFIRMKDLMRTLERMVS